MSVTCRMPELRFGEFSGEWEEKLLNQVAQINPRAKELPDEFVYIDLESVEKGLLVKKNKILKIGAPSRAQRLLVNQDILFQTVRPYQKNNYYFELGDNYVASTGYAQIRTNESSAFLYQKLHTDKFVNKVLLRCTGTSYPAINSTDLSKIKISIPSKQEQEKIASFLSSVDSRIEQLTKKEQLLREYKKGVMQKIFSQELRFHPKGISSQAQGTDDDGSEFPEWVEKRLGEIGIFTKGKGISKNDIVEKGNLECIHYGELYTDYKEIISKTISKTNKKSDDLVLSRANDVIIPSSGETTLDIATASCVLKDNIALGGDLNIIRTKENGVFLSYYLNNEKKYDIAKLAQGSSVVHLYSTHLKTLKINLPSLKEQTKIANFLSSLDTKIEQVRKELKLTKEFKKALLQKMFV